MIILMPYSNLIEQEDMAKQNAINDDEYEKAVKTTIKQGFSCSICHNSQTLLQKNVCGR